MDKMFIILWVLRFLSKNYFLPNVMLQIVWRMHRHYEKTLLSHTRCWLRPDFLLTDVFGNRFENRACFKKFDVSCCFEISSISLIVLRFATMLKRPNDEALFYHTLMFGWVVLPFSDVFWAEESWLLLLRNVLFCSRYFDYHFRSEIGIWKVFLSSRSVPFFHSECLFIFLRNLLRKENLFLSK